MGITAISRAYSSRLNLFNRAVGDWYIYRMLFTVVGVADKMKLSILQYELSVGFVFDCVFGRLHCIDTVGFYVLRENLQGVFFGRL